MEYLFLAGALCFVPVFIIGTALCLYIAGIFVVGVLFEWLTDDDKHSLVFHIRQGIRFVTEHKLWQKGE